MFQGMIGLANDLAAIEVGALRLMIDSAAFEKDNAAAPGKEPARRSLAGRALSDDGDVGR
jgi:hypothetical protein